MILLKGSESPIKSSFVLIPNANKMNAKRQYQVTIIVVFCISLMLIAAITGIVFYLTR